MRYLVLAVLLALVPAARADQFQVVDPETLEYAKHWLPIGQPIRLYCAPCGDEHWTEAIVATLESRPFEEEQAEILVNSQVIDLAYVYAPLFGEWRNLADQLDLSPTDVPATLDTCIPGAPGGFSHVQFRGGIGDTLKIRMDLVLSGGKLSGVYAYEHIGQPIALLGEVDPETKAFTLKESVDGQHSGTFSGTFTRQPLRFEGEWNTPAGDKPRPFQAAAYATPVHALHSGEGGGMHYGSNWHYPILMTPGAPDAAALNTAIMNAYESAYRDFRNSWASLPAEDFLADWDEPPVSMRGYEQSITDYAITLHQGGLFSMAFNVWEYTGGAHGNSNCITLNLRTGETLTALKLNDVIGDSEESIKAVSDFLIADLKKQEASSVVSGSITAFAIDELPAWSLSPQGITFHFAPYAVASYAEGAFEVLMPWEALGEHAKLKVE